MNVKGGALEFDIIANNGKMNSALEETKKRVKGFSDATVEGGKAIESMFDATADNLNIQKRVVKELEFQYARLQKEIGKVAAGKPQQELLAQSEKVRRELDGERKALAQLDVAVNKNSVAQAKLTTQLRDIVEELARMEEAGLRGSEAYTRLRKEAGRLNNALGDARQQAKILANDNAGLQGVISAVSGFTGAMSAAQGAVSLFAGENENLQRIMVKIQSLMAITIGLQQVANTVNKDSYFRIVILTKVKNLFAAATARSSAALVKFGISAGVANVAAKALMGTLTLGLSVAIGLAVAAIDRLNNKREEAQRKLKEQIRVEGDARAEMIKTRFELETTMRSIKNFTGTKEQEKGKVEELNRKYGDSFGVYKTLAEWYDVISKKSEDYIQLLFLQAKAQSLVNKAVEADQKVQELKAANPDDVEGHMPLAARMGHRMMQGAGAQGPDSEELIAKFNKEAKEKAIKAAQDMREGFLQEAGKLQDEMQKLTSKFKIDIKPATGGKNDKDPFTELLTSKKREFAEYSKWLRSSAEEVRKAASVEFANLIKEGDSYEKYLKNLKAKLAKEPVSSARDSQLKAVTNELLELEESSYVDGYKKELEEQLALAGGLLEKLSLIAKKREDLNKPGTELKEDKTGILDKEQLKIGKEVQEDYNKAMQDYNNYLQDKIDAELSYLNKRKELEIQIEIETDAERKKILETQLNSLQVRHTAKEEIDYDALVAAHKTYEQKCADISAEFDKEIALAKKKNNAELLAQLEQDKAKALSSAAFDEIQNSDLFQKLFSNLDNMTASEMIKLRNTAEREWSKLKLSPKEFDALRDKLTEFTRQIEQKNPFAALTDAIKRYKGAQDDVAKKAGLEDIFKGVAASADMVKGTFDSVVDGLKELGLAGDEVNQQLLGDISKMLGSVSQLAGGIATSMSTGNPMGIIQGSVSLISSAFAVFNTRDRKAERAIRKHAASVKDLGKEYKNLEKAVDGALGSGRYTTQASQIDNLKKQQREYAAMAEAERGKKKSDSGKIEEYENARAENAEKIAQIVDGMREEITGSARDIANNLGNAFIDAFAAGENAMDAFKKKADDVVAGIIRKMLIQKLLEEPIGRIIEKYQKKWVDSNGNFSGFDIVMEDAQTMGRELKGIGGEFAVAMENLPEEIKKYFTGGKDTDPANSLSGAIKGASQQSIDLLAGQTNAVRVNQVKSAEILRQQLFHLALIASRIGTSNKHLESIDNKIGKDYDPLRPQGFNLK